MTEPSTESPGYAPAASATADPAPARSFDRAAELRALITDVLLDGSAEAYFVLRNDWRILYLNEQAERLVQRPRHELLGTDAREAFPEAVGAPIHDACIRAFEGGENVVVEDHYAPLDTWFEARLYPRGELLVANLRRIDRRKQAQEALRRSEERFQLAAQATLDILWDYDFGEDRLWWSDNFGRLLGYPPDAVGTTFESWERHVHPADRERAVAAVRRAVDARLPRIAEEYRLVSRDGRHIHVLDRMRFLYDPDGSPRRAVGVLVDVTDQKIAEARQRFLIRAGQVMAATMDFHQRLRELARLCCGPLSDYCVVDVIEEDGRIRRLEAAHVDPAMEPLARDLLRFPPVHDRDAGVPRALRTGELVLVENVTDEDLRRLAQSEEHLAAVRALRPRSYMVVPLRARETTLGAIVLTLTRPGRRFGEEDRQLARELARQAAMDIHNARLHRDVERARRAAEEASHAKGQFLAMMSHELRTPITVMINFADLMASGASGPVTEQQRDRIERMKASAWHLVAMVDEVLAYSRMEAGAELPKLETADAVRIVRDVAHVLAPQAGVKGLEIGCDTPDHPVLLRTDPGKLRQIITNLLGNAVKFTRAGEIRVEMDPPTGEHLEIRVRDTGPGIAPEHRERIFDAFVQVEDPDTRTHGGTGLGLAISRRFARMLGGDVVVESERGKGSTFILRLPLGTDGGA